jgi:hypothetical protein
MWEIWGLARGTGVSLGSGSWIVAILRTEYVCSELEAVQHFRSFLHIFKSLDCPFHAV